MFPQKKKRKKPILRYFQGLREGKGNANIYCNRDPLLLEMSKCHNCPQFFPKSFPFNFWKEVNITSTLKVFFKSLSDPLCKKI